MSISRHDRLTIYKSYRLIAAQGETLTDIFYENLFKIDPSLASLFHKSVKIQGANWRQMFRTVIMAVDRLQDIEGELEALSIRHLSYGVTEADYDKMGEALLMTLEQCLVNEFTPEVREAWQALYGNVADTMKAVYRRHAAP